VKLVCPSGIIQSLASLVIGVFMTATTLATNQISVMTFNLRFASAADGVDNWINSSQSPERRNVAFKTILNHAPDIIGFQEGEDSQLDYLATNLPEYTFERRKPSGGGGNENAAFAWNTNKLEMIDRGLFSLGPSPGGGYWNNTPGTPFDPWDLFPENNNPFPRLAMWGNFLWKPTGQHFLFYSTHFDVYNGANSGTSQVKSAAMIVSDAKARNDRMPISPLTIVVGDFNGSQNDRAWQLFTGSYSDGSNTGDFTDSWLQAHGNFNNSGTFHGFTGTVQSANRRIDWILHRGGFTTASAQVLYDSAIATNLNNGTTRSQFPSDHYPVKAILILPPVSPDHDRDGLPDAVEFNSPRSHAVDTDSDNDMLVDGKEDLNGNGIVDGGETDPLSFSITHNPTDIRHYQMNGLRDFKSSLLAHNGLELWTFFDGRYLYVATQDAGESSDHFILICTSATDAVNAPWAKSGQVSRWLAFLADENDSGFHGWFNTSGNMITNFFTARSATLYQNDGRLEGVIDLGQLLSPGFTTPIYIAAAPYNTADGGSLVTSAQVPAGNGDGNILGVSEYAVIFPGDDDGDGISNVADPDRDGDGLPDDWENAFGITGRGDDDPDGDHSENRHEYFACTDPANSGSVFEIHHQFEHTYQWKIPLGKTSSAWRLTGTNFNPDGNWQQVTSMANNSSFPYLITNIFIAADQHYLQVRQSP